MDKMSTHDNSPIVKVIISFLLIFCICDTAATARWNPELGISTNVTRNHAALLNYIRNTEGLLMPPSKEEYNLEHPNIDPSMGQSELVKKYLANKTNGFFIECGAYDGFVVSNTLDLEKNFGWSGLLIEADPNNYALLQEKNRKAWTVNACLAIHNYPHMVLFQQDGHLGKIYSSKRKKVGSKQRKNRPKKNLTKIQCIPLNDLLSALNVTTVDYFSLDVEGNELQILQTISFDKVLIKVISVECVTSRKQLAVTRFLNKNGFKFTGQVNNEHDGLMDLMFVHKSLKASKIYSAKPDYIKVTL